MRIYRHGADHRAKTPAGDYTTRREEVENFGGLRAVEALRKFTSP
jgi:hypothetical protein